MPSGSDENQIIQLLDFFVVNAASMFRFATPSIFLSVAVREQTASSLIIKLNSTVTI